MIKDGDRIVFTMVFKGVFSVCDVSFDGLSGAFALDPLLVSVNDKKMYLLYQICLTALCNGTTQMI